MKKEVKTENVLIKLLDTYTDECEKSLINESLQEDFSAAQADMIERIWYLKTISDEAERVTKILKEKLNETYPEGVELEVNTENGVYSAKHTFRKGYVKPAVEVAGGYQWQFKRLYSLNNK